MTEILYGDALANQMVSEVATKFETYSQLGRVAHFTTILVGDDPASKRYIGMKQTEGADLGLEMSRIDLPADISQDKLEETITEISEQEDSHALLIQYPLPSGLDYLRAISKLDPRKDVDGLHPANLGLLMHDPANNYPGLIPCTPNGILQLLCHGGVELDGANITIIGRGMTVGAPLTMLLSAQNNGAHATVTTVHKGTRNIAEHTNNADIVIGAVGRPGLITGDMVKDGATLVSVGVTYDKEGRAQGDFTKDARQKAAIYVPVTRGIGPMTRANLWENVLRCYELQTQ